MSRESHKVFQEKINEHIKEIGNWINVVEGKNIEEAIGFIHKYFHHLNDITKKSMYEHLLDKTEKNFWK